MGSFGILGSVQTECRRYVHVGMASSRTALSAAMGWLYWVGNALCRRHRHPHRRGWTRLARPPVARIQPGLVHRTPRSYDPRLFSTGDSSHSPADRYGQLIEPVVAFGAGVGCHQISTERCTSFRAAPIANCSPPSSSRFRATDNNLTHVAKLSSQDQVTTRRHIGSWH